MNRAVISLSPPCLVSVLGKMVGKLSAYDEMPMMISPAPTRDVPAMTEYFSKCLNDVYPSMMVATKTSNFSTLFISIGPTIK